MPIGNGGIIGPANVPTLLSAKGVWSLREAQLAQRQGIWPLGLIPDPYFEYTTLLLPGNGTNGAQNNTFLDASTNNFTITRNGNTTQGTFSPFSQTGWGNYFVNASNQYLSLSSSDFAVGTGAFTIEGWVFLTSYTYGSVFSSWNAVNTGTGMMLGFDNTGRVQFSVGNASGSADTTIFTTAVIPLNTWTFLQATKAAGSGGAMTIYINGSSSANTTTTRSIDRSAAVIGRYYQEAAGNQINGYLSNVRVSNTVRSSTVPTTPFTNDGNTLLLTCQSNRFVDNSTTPKTLTPQGSPSVQAFSPFNPVVPWTAATNGGSGYFDGSGDYIVTTGGSAIAVGSGAFTLEGWLYLNSVNTDGAGFGSCATTADGSSDRGVSLLIQTGGSWRFRVGRSVAGQFEDFVGTTSLTTGQWYHFQLIRTSTGTNDTKSYLNGVLQATGTSTIGVTMQKFSVGTYAPSDSSVTLLNGYAAGVRLTNTALTSGVPTSPPTAVTGTAILLNFTNAGIYDATSKNDLETVGNAQISTTQSKWGGGSIYLDGSSSYLRAQSNAGPSAMSMMFGTGPYTIEMWVYQTSRNSNGAYLISNQQLQANITSTGTVNVNLAGGGNYATTTTTVPLSTWTYIAFVRTSTSANGFKIYINGVDSATGTDSTNYSSAAQINIGTTASGNSLYVLTGYIDDLRITNYARTISASPSAPFPVQ